MDPEDVGDGTNQMGEGEFDSQFRLISEKLLDAAGIKGMGKRVPADRLAHIHHHAHGLKNKLPGGHKFRLNTAFTGLMEKYGISEDQKKRIEQLKALVEKYSGERIHIGTLNP